MHVIAPTARVSALADLEDSVRGSTLTVADGVTIDAFVKVKFTGGSGDVTIGANSYVNSGTVIYSGNGVTIGRDVLIAAGCVFAATNHEYARRDVPIRAQGFRPSKGGIVVEDDVWLGAGTVLLDGAVVRRGAVVAANSVVRGEVESYAVVGGSPVRRLGARGRC